MEIVVNTRVICCLHCPVTPALWSRMLLEFGVFCVWPLDYQDILLHASGIGDLTSRRKKLWNVAVLAICWSLWLVGNNRIFEDIRGEIDSIWEKVG